MSATTAPPRRVPLCEAEPLAAELETLLEPACIRIEIAGSIRRQAAEVKDIELVCVPRMVARGGDEKLLFPLSESDETLDLASAVDGRVETLCGARAVDLQYDTLKPANGSRQKRLLFHRVQVDLFILIPPADWGVMFTLRTGPAVWSKRLVTNRKHGGLLPDRLAVCGGGQLVESRQHVVPVLEERNFFAICGLPWVEPAQRTFERLCRLLQGRGNAPAPGADRAREQTSRDRRGA
jgi:DNA polymerase/3'-5' exonuclease PolX